jgi:hypothetical protein
LVYPVKKRFRIGQERTNKDNSEGFGKCLGNVWNILYLIINDLILFFGKCLGNVWEMFGVE